MTWSHIGLISVKAAARRGALIAECRSEAARFLGEEGEFGVIATGARADTILVEGDPLRDLDALRNPSYVMVNGHLWDRPAIQREVDGLACGADPQTPPAFGESGWDNAGRRDGECLGGQASSEPPAR